MAKEKKVFCKGWERHRFFFFKSHAHTTTTELNQIKKKERERRHLRRLQSEYVIRLERAPRARAGAGERVGSGLRAGAGPACPRAPGGEGRGERGGEGGGRAGRREGGRGRAGVGVRGRRPVCCLRSGGGGGSRGRAGERARLSCSLSHPGGILQNLSSEIHGEMANRIDGFHTLLARQSRSLP